MKATGRTDSIRSIFKSSMWTPFLITIPTHRSRYGCSSIFEAVASLREYTDLPPGGNMFTMGTSCRERGPINYCSNLLSWETLKQATIEDTFSRNLMRLIIPKMSLYLRASFNYSHLGYLTKGDTVPYTLLLLKLSAWRRKDTGEKGPIYGPWWWWLSSAHLLLLQHKFKSCWIQQNVVLK